MDAHTQAVRRRKGWRPKRPSGDCWLGRELWNLELDAGREPILWRLFRNCRLFFFQSP